MKMMKNNINIKYKKSNILQTVKYSTDFNSKDLSIISVKFYKNADAQSKNNIKPAVVYINADTPKLDSNWVTGFVDGEGCFSINIFEDPKYKTGFRVQARFLINIHKKDIAMLELIKLYFGGKGNIYKGKNSSHYQVISLRYLTNVIIPILKSIL
jgi:hypothetical protein